MLHWYHLAHFKSTGVRLLILSLNLLNTTIYLRIVIYEDLFERIHVDLLELMHVDLFPKIYRNLFRSPEREWHNKTCYLVRGWRQTPSCLPGWKTPNPCKLQDQSRVLWPDLEFRSRFAVITHNWIIIRVLNPVTIIFFFNIALPQNVIFGSVQSIAYATLLERSDDNALRDGFPGSQRPPCYFWRSCVFDFSTQYLLTISTVTVAHTCCLLPLL